MTATTSNYRFALALLMALTLHAVLLVAPKLEFSNARTPPELLSLDVLLVEQADPTPPSEVEYLAPVTARGGGVDPDDPQRPETMPAPAVQPAAPVQSPPERQSTPAPTPAVAEAEQALPEDEIQDQTEPPDASRLLQESLALARAQGDRTATSGPRRKTISANTREHTYAAYMRNWVRKVERVGNNNYPEHARRQNLEGSLILRVDIRADGSVDRVELMRSSGHDILDQAALRIVNLAAPYAPLPPEIAAEVDILTISRTWQFSTQRGWQ